MSNVLFGIYNTTRHGFGQTKAGYVSFRRLRHESILISLLVGRKYLWTVEHHHSATWYVTHPPFVAIIGAYHRTGGYMGDLVYRRWGVSGKKYLVLLMGVLQGALSIGMGVFIDHHHHGKVTPSRQCFLLRT